MNRAPNATAYMDIWCFAMSITICNNRGARGIWMSAKEKENKGTNCTPSKTLPNTHRDDYESRKGT